MKCVMCGNETMRASKADYVYDRHGVAVTLVGIRVLQCSSCGEEDIEIPRIAELDRVIARHLIERTGHLAGTEIRFLRKFLGLSGTDFAELIGVAPETVSRWENGHQTMDRGHENTLRLLAARRAPIDDYRVWDALRAIDQRPEPKTQVIRLRPEADTWADAA